MRPSRHHLLSRAPRSSFIAVFLGALICSGCATLWEQRSNRGTSSRQEAITSTHRDVERLLSACGGLDVLETKLAPFRSCVASKLPEEPKTRVSVVGVDPVMAFDSYHCAVAVDTRWPRPQLVDRESGVADPVSAIVNLSRWLHEDGIDFIYVLVPAKIEVYPEKVCGQLEQGLVISPQRSRFMLALLEAGVEVVDLLPELLREKHRGSEHLYLARSHHLSYNGVVVTAREISARLERYLATEERNEVFELKANHGSRGRMLDWAVIDSTGREYSPAVGSPVLIMGDSQVHAFGSGGVDAQIARFLQMSVSRYSKDGSSSTMHTHLKRKGRGFLENRRVIVWVSTAIRVEAKSWPLIASDQ